MQSQNRRVRGLEYTLIRKKVKNVNLRIRADGSVMVSAPGGVSAEQIDGFVASRIGWIVAAKQKAHRRIEQEQKTPLPSKQACMALFESVSQRIYPAFETILNGIPPTLTVRDMTSCWGVCHPQKGKITLAQRLAAKPLEAVEYVILHEYCHFVYPNHQKEFWALMQRFMPDWKARRALLR